MVANCVVACRSQPPGTMFPIYFNATDPDFGDSVTFNLDAGPASQYFTVAGHHLYQAEPVDLGTNVAQTYHLILQGVDQSGLACTAHVYVRVEQVNDPHHIVNLPTVIFVDAQTADNADTVRGQWG